MGDPGSKNQNFDGAHFPLIHIRISGFFKIYGRRKKSGKKAEGYVKIGIGSQRVAVQISLRFFHTA